MSVTNAPDLESAVDELISRRQPPALHFQPVVDLHRLRVVGYEALSRFPGPLQATPDRWFAAAQRIDREVELEALVIEQAIPKQDLLGENQLLGVNVSPAAIQSDEVRRVLHKAPLSRLIFELTEHDSVRDYDLLTRAVADIRAMGGFVAVDDAGAGYSNFHHILKIRPDFVKLDRSIITDLQSEDARVALVEMFSSFSSKINSWLVVEGIEEPGELRLLRELGIPLGQGYLLGAPAPSMNGIDPALAEQFPPPTSGHGDTIGELSVSAPTAPSDADDATLIALLAQHPDRPGVVLVDAATRPTGLVLRDGTGAITRRHNPLIVDGSTSTSDALVQAMRRPVETRFDPLVCRDGDGKCCGIATLMSMVPGGPDATAPRLG